MEGRHDREGVELIPRSFTSLFGGPVPKAQELRVADILDRDLALQLQPAAAGFRIAILNAGGKETVSLAEKFAEWFRLAGFSVRPPLQPMKEGTATGLFIALTESGLSFLWVAEIIARQCAAVGVECAPPKGPSFRLEDPAW